MHNPHSGWGAQVATGLPGRTGSTAMRTGLPAPYTSACIAMLLRYCQLGATSRHALSCGRRWLVGWSEGTDRMVHNGPTCSLHFRLHFLLLRYCQLGATARHAIDLWPALCKLAGPDGADLMVRTEAKQASS